MGSPQGRSRELRGGLATRRLECGSVSAQSLGDQLSGQGLKKTDQISLFRCTKPERYDQRILGSTRARLPALIVKLYDVIERRKAARVHVRRRLRDVAQTRGAEGAHLRWILRQAVELGLAIIGTVAERTGAAERVRREPGDGGEATFVSRRDVRAGLRHAEIVELVVGKHGSRVAGDAASLADEKLRPSFGLIADRPRVARN